MCCLDSSGVAVTSAMALIDLSLRSRMIPGEGNRRTPANHGGCPEETCAEPVGSCAENSDLRESTQPAARLRPAPKSDLVSRQMSRMPRRNTKPELLLRRELHGRGLRFRLHPPLPGRPDLVFTRAKIAVFVDGCFWHGCPEHGTLPKNNREWWREKIDGNIRRDRLKDEALGLLGWEVLHVWEHEAPESAADRVEDLWRRKTLRPRADPGRSLEM